MASLLASGEGSGGGGGGPMVNFESEGGGCISKVFVLLGGCGNSTATGTHLVDDHLSSLDLHDNIPKIPTEKLIHQNSKRKKSTVKTTVSLLEVVILTETVTVYSTTCCTVRTGTYCCEFLG